MSFPVWLHPTLRRFQSLRTTRANPRLYSHAGTLLLWLALPVSTIDYLIAPDFFAPHPDCASYAIPAFNFMLAALPWAVVSFLAVSMITVPATKNRQGGADIFDLSLGAPPWNWIISAPVFALIVYFGSHLWETVWWLGSLQTVTSDCGGKAEPLTVAVTAPSIQFMPVLEGAICLWLLHIRALALSPQAAASST